jgi:hypothetical protein
MAGPTTQQQTVAEPLNVEDDFPIEELLKHRGQWVAFSPDGKRIVASSVSLPELDRLVRAAGESPEEVLLEQVPDVRFIESGSELS